MIPPVLVRHHALYGTGFFPGDAEQVYSITDDDLFLVGTSEVPLAAFHADEIFDEDELPVRYAGYSTCFRREAGTYGKDTRGIFGYTNSTRSRCSRSFGLRIRQPNTSSYSPAKRSCLAVSNCRTAPERGSG